MHRNYMKAKFNQIWADHNWSKRNYPGHTISRRLEKLEWYSDRRII